MPYAASAGFNIDTHDELNVLLSNTINRRENRLERLCQTRIEGDTDSGRIGGDRDVEIIQEA